MIVTFGSINCDFIFCVAAMPEPGQTILSGGFRTEAGGKGANQAVAAARDGATLIMVGAVGQDSVADIAMQNLNTCGADVSRVVQLSEPTGCASIYTDCDGRNMIVVASGANLMAKAAQVTDDLLTPDSILVMQMENDPAEISLLIRRAHEKGARTVLNLAPAHRLDADILSLVSLIVVNEDEANALAGWLGGTASAMDLAKCLGTGVMRTLGGEGAEAFYQGEYVTIPAAKVNVRDTTAAGDCFIGVLAAALDRNLPLRAAMERAAAAAAIACTRPGSQSSIPLASEIDAFMR